MTNTNWLPLYFQEPVQASLQATVHFYQEARVAQSRSGLIDRSAQNNKQGMSIKTLDEGFRNIDIMMQKMKKEMLRLKNQVEDTVSVNKIYKRAAQSRRPGSGAGAERFLKRTA